MSVLPLEALVRRVEHLRQTCEKVRRVTSTSSRPVQAASTGGPKLPKSLAALNDALTKAAGQGMSTVKTRLLDEEAALAADIRGAYLQACNSLSLSVDMAVLENPKIEVVADTIDMLKEELSSFDRVSRRAVEVTEAWASLLSFLGSPGATRGVTDQSVANALRNRVEELLGDVRSKTVSLLTLYSALSEIPT